jgi:hypothetical protein
MYNNYNDIDKLTYHLKLISKNPELLWPL